MDQHDGEHGGNFTHKEAPRRRDETTEFPLRLCVSLWSFLRSLRRRKCTRDHTGFDRQRAGAPAASAAAASVAPVVITSSTIAMRRPATTGSAANALRTLRRAPSTAARPAPASRGCGKTGDCRRAAESRQAPRDLLRLVEAALALARRRERQGDEQVGPRRDRPRQCGREAVGVGERAAVFQGLQQTVQRKRVGERGARGGQRRRMREATAAYDAAGCGQRAARARGAEARQRASQAAQTSAPPAAPRTARSAAAARGVPVASCACTCQIMRVRNLTSTERSSTLRART